MTENIIKVCPNCGKRLQKRPTYSFHYWGTISFVAIISLMLLALDIIPESGSKIDWNLDWAHWTVLGIWIFYLSVQLLRYNVDYGWILIPFAGVLFSIFFYFLDISDGANTGFLGLDWGWYLIIPWITFVVILPIFARIARNQPEHIEILRDFVDQLEDEFNNGN